MRRKGFEASFWAGFLNALYGCRSDDPWSDQAASINLAGSGIRPRGSHLCYFNFDPQTFQAFTIDLILKRKLGPVLGGFA